jgi:hypothetical protein
MPDPIKLPKEVTKGSDGRWYKACPSCGVSCSYLRRNYAYLSYKEGKTCKKCSNSIPENNSHKGWYLDVLRISFARKYEVNAKLRGFSWDIEYEYLAQLLIDQDFKCALTGWDIQAMGIGNNTASLDRIDSSLGYTPDNVQWVHKMVNMCKQQYSQDDFVDMCNAVSQHAAR